MKLLHRKIVDINNWNSLQKAVDILRHNSVLIFPTDTVYGIGCALKKPAIRRLYKIKNRPAAQPTAVLLTKKNFYNFRSSENCRNWEGLAKDIKDGFLSGKITVIFPVEIFNKIFDVKMSNIPKMILSADGKVGVRLPQYRWLQNLINKVGPIAASSANKKGELPPKNFAEINPALFNQADLVIKTDQSTVNQPSRIYDTINKKYIR